MRPTSFVLATLLLAAPLAAAPASKMYVGTITDSMCIRDHAAMGTIPPDTCVVQCVKHSKDNKLVLAVDGKTAYILSDQETPLKFAAQKVKVIGVLYPKTNVLKVESIEAVK
jgi:hypothetical protein